MTEPTAYMIRHTHEPDAYGERAKTVEFTDSPAAYAAYNFEADITELYAGSVAAAASEMLEALKLHLAYEATPSDRGGPTGPKGRAWTAFIAARDAAIQKATGERV